MDDVWNALRPGPGVSTPSIDRWMRRHDACATAPMVHAPNRQMSALAESAWSTATDSLEHGLPVMPLIHVLMDNGGVLSLPVDIPLDRAERAVAQELVAYTIRDFACRRGMVPVGAVAVVESWLSQTVDAAVRPSNDPARQEGLLLIGTTRTRGVTRFATVRRLAGVRELGPAVVGESTNVPLSQHSMLDGLLASPHKEG